MDLINLVNAEVRFFMEDGSPAPNELCIARIVSLREECPFMGPLSDDGSFWTDEDEGLKLHNEHRSALCEFMAKRTGVLALYFYNTNDEETECEYYSRGYFYSVYREWPMFDAGQLRTLAGELMEARERVRLILANTSLTVLSKNGKVLGTFEASREAIQQLDNKYIITNRELFTALQEE